MWGGAGGTRGGGEEGGREKRCDGERMEEREKIREREIIYRLGKMEWKVGRDGK